MTFVDLLCNEDGRVIEFRYKKKQLHEANLYLAADRNINPGLTRWQASVNKNNVGLLLP